MYFTTLHVVIGVLWGMVVLCPAIGVLCIVLGVLCTAVDWVCYVDDGSVRCRYSDGRVGCVIYSGCV